MMTAPLHPHPDPRPSARRLPGDGDCHRHTVREGIRLGLLVAAVTLAWVTAFDFAVGRPFETIHVLGGAAVFLPIHVTLCVAYGLAIVGAVHSALSTPTVVFAMIFLTILFQAAFVMLTAFTTALGLGALAWPRLLGGNVLAAALTYWFIARRHPLRELYHAAEADM